jgi:FkbM family methyltransferase
MDLYNYNNLLNKYSSSGIKIINCAVSDKNDRISYFSGNGGCPNIFGQHENNSFVGYKIGEVDCYTLDYLFNNQKIDVLKMDIEGAEYQALSGGKNVLKQCKFIMIECHTESEFSKINKLLIEDLEKDVYCLKYLHKKTIDSPFSYQIVAVNKKYEIVNGKINLKDESR